MAGINAAEVYVGAPDQSGTSGAVHRAPLGTAYPANAREPLNTGYRRGGYVSDGGVTITPEHSTTDITEWGGALVRRILESFTGTISFEFLQIGYDEAVLVFGEDYVTRTAAGTDHGTQMKIAIGARLPEAGVWGFAIKDGDKLIKIIAPNAQPINVTEIALVSNDAVKLGTELACYPDEDGNAIYLLTDDGIFAGQIPEATSVTVTGPTGVDEGSSVQLTATAALSNGQSVNATLNATWSSDDPLVATVTDGSVAGIAAGTTSVTATYGGITSSAFAITVSEPV